MPTYGPNFGSAASGSGSPDIWVNPSNVFANDGAYAECVLEGGDKSELLEVTGFGFSISPLETLAGIEVAIERSVTVDPDITDDTVQLIKGGVAVSDDKADLVTNWPTTDTVKTYGGALDDWNFTGTISDINASNFGVSIRCASSAGATARIDYITMTVYTTGAAADTGSIEAETRLPDRRGAVLSVSRRIISWVNTLRRHNWLLRPASRISLLPRMAMSFPR